MIGNKTHDYTNNSPRRILHHRRHGNTNTSSTAPPNQQHSNSVTTDSLLLPSTSSTTSTGIEQQQLAQHDAYGKKQSIIDQKEGQYTNNLYHNLLDHIQHNSSSYTIHHIPLPTTTTTTRLHSASEYDEDLVDTNDNDDDDSHHHEMSSSDTTDIEANRISITSRLLRRRCCYVMYRYWYRMRYNLLSLYAHCMTTSHHNRDDTIKTSKKRYCRYHRLAIPLNYNMSYLIHDIYAGWIVSLMAIPQSLSYAKLAGLPIEYGLYSSITPCIIYAITGSSPYLIVGPVALISLLLHTGLSSVMSNYNKMESTSLLTNLESNYTTTINNNDNEILYIQLAIQTSILVGIGMILLGLCNISKLITILLLPRPIISGFTTGAAITIALSQLKYILGINGGGDTILYMLHSYYQNINQFHYQSFILSMINILILVGLKQQNGWYRSLGPFIVTFIGICIGKIQSLSLNITTSNNIVIIPIVGYIPKGLPSISLSNIIPTSLHQFYYHSYILLPTVISIIIVGYMESYAMAQQLSNKQKHKDNNTKIKVSISSQQEQLSSSPPRQQLGEYNLISTNNSIDLTDHSTNINDDNMNVVEEENHNINHNNHHMIELDSNREMIALGLSNLIGGIFNSYPVAGSLSRSAVNYESGGISIVSSIITSLFVIFTILYITSIIQYLPLCTLSCIVITGVIPGLLDFTYSYIYLYSYYNIISNDFIIWNIAFFGTICIGVEYGLLLAVLYNICSFIYAFIYPTIYILGRLNGTCHYRNIQQYNNQPHLEISIATATVATSSTTNGDNHNNHSTSQNDNNNNTSLEQYPGIQIVKFDAPLFFANASYIHDCILSYNYDSLEDEEYNISSTVRSVPTTDSVVVEQILPSMNNIQVDNNNNTIGTTNHEKIQKVRSLIIDMSSVSYMDTIGLHHLTMIIDHYYNNHLASSPPCARTCPSSRNDGTDTDHQTSITMSINSVPPPVSYYCLPVCLVNPSEYIIQMLLISNNSSTTDGCLLISKFQLFTCVHDAVIDCLQKLSHHHTTAT